MWEHKELVWENRAHCWCRQPKGDEPALYKKQSGASQQMLILHGLGFCSWLQVSAWAHDLASFYDPP